MADSEALSPKQADAATASGGASAEGEPPSTRAAVRALLLKAVPSWSRAMFLAHPTGMLAHIEESLVAMVPEGITSESAEVLAEVVAGGFFAALVKAPLHCDPAMEWRVIRSLAADLHPGATSRAFPLFAGAKAESIRRKASVAADDALTLSPEWTAFAHNLALQLEKRLVPGASMEAGEVA